MGFTWDELDAISPEAKNDWRLPLPPTCPTCSYNLTGLPTNRCPECGERFDWQDVRHHATYIWTQTLRLKHANRDAKLGLVLVLAGWAAMGLFRVRGLSTLSPVVNVIAVGMAVLSIPFGVHVFNVWRVPPWARCYIGDPPPNVMQGGAVLVLALGLIVGAILIP